MKGSCCVPLQLQLLLASCLLLTTSVIAIPLDQFYPFGEQSGDNLVGRTLDGSSSNITLPLPFTFFEESYDDIYVSTSIMNKYLKPYIHLILCNYDYTQLIAHTIVQANALMYKG